MVVFPENIAYYHPVPPQNRVFFTVLHDSTLVTLQPSGSAYIMPSGLTQEVVIEPELELDKANVSTKVLTLTSNKDIAVEILSHRNNSIQTAVLLPTDQLGLQYQVPPIPLTGPHDLYGLSGTEEVTERSPFKLILVSTEDQNTITLPGSGPIQLDADEAAQFWVYKKMVGKTVTGTKPFLALFAHTCAILYNCTCGALYTPLQPHNATELTFVVPPVFGEDAETQTYLLKPSDANPVDFVSSSHGSFEERGPVVLHRPGLLMNLIPEEEFGSCFTVHAVAQAAENWAVIVAPAGSTEDVQIGRSPVGGVWSEVPGTGDKYKYVKVQLNGSYSIVWHKSELMAVYFLGKTVQDRNAWFGNPAPRLSKIPDRRGCVVEPEVMEVLHEEKSWQKSIQACRSQGLDLISLSDQTLQTQVYNWALGLNLNLTELWMGLRRSSYSSKWYWISEDPLNHEDWSQGSPGGLEDGKCGRISLKDFKNPGWIHQHCCATAKAVCYRPPKLLTLY